MRYDDFDDFDSRSSRNKSRRDFDSRNARGGWEPDRGYSSRDYGNDFDRKDNYRSDRDETRRLRDDDWDGHDDFDRYNWERTAPNWAERSAGGHRKKEKNSSGRDPQRDPKSSGRSPQNDRTGSRSPQADRNGQSGRGSQNGRGSQSGRRPNEGRPNEGRRPPEGQRPRSGNSSGRRPPDSYQRRPQKRKRKTNMLPVVLVIILVAVVALVVKSCVGNSGKGDYHIQFSTQSIVVGETAQATITGIPSGQSPVITWSSSDTNVVTVSDKGLLSAKSEGTATIAATIEGRSASGTVMVVKTAVGVKSITLNAEKATVVSGESYTIQATVNMENQLSPASVTWTSNDASVARVSNDGVVTARDVGTTIVKATSGNKTAECVITVVENSDATKHDESKTTGQTADDESGDGTAGTTGGAGTTSGTTGSGSTGATSGKDTTTDKTDSSKNTEGSGTSDKNLGSDITGTTSAGSGSGSDTKTTD